MKRRLGLIVMLCVIAVILLMIPAVAHDTQEITINEGALYTVTREVSLASVTE
jgi:competence protein ComGC